MVPAASGWERVEERPVRLFVGLEIPDPLARAVRELQRGLPGARWMASDALHLTLAFIGEVDEGVRRRVEAALRRVRAPPLRLALQGPGHFPLRGPPRVLWVGVSPAPALVSLATGVRLELASAGVALERRSFAPHVTIARFRRPPSSAGLHAWLERHAGFRSSAIQVSSFRLFSSSLQPSGACYTVEGVFPLEGPPAAEG